MVSRGARTPAQGGRHETQFRALCHCLCDPSGNAVAHRPHSQRNRPLAAQRPIADRPNSADTTSPILDLETVRAALHNRPFDYLIAANFIRREWRDRLIDDCPAIKKAGSFPLSTVKVGADFARLIAEMDGAAFRQVVEEKFSLKLGDRPTMLRADGAASRDQRKPQRGRAPVQRPLVAFAASFDFRPCRRLEQASEMVAGDHRTNGRPTRRRGRGMRRQSGGDDFAAHGRCERAQVA